MLSVLCGVFYAECRYAECCYAGCPYSQCCYAEYFYTKCCYAEWYYVGSCYSKCRYATNKLNELVLSGIREGKDYPFSLVHPIYYSVNMTSSF